MAQLKLLMSVSLLIRRYAFTEVYIFDNFISAYGSCTFTFQVTCIGQIIGLVIGKTRLLAQRAAKLVKIEYVDLPTITTIEVCIMQNFYAL